MSREKDINAAIELIEDAFERGEIEEKRRGGRWRRAACVARTDKFEYRAKPRPREFWANTEALVILPADDDWTPAEIKPHYIKVREVIE